MTRDGMSLKEFIEKNHTLLSALAIFATITALLGNLPIHWIGIILSFISITGLIVIWYELKTQLPEKMAPALFIFRYVLLWGFGMLIFYWLLEFREIWHLFLVIPLTILFGYEIVSTLKPLKETKIAKYVFGINKKKNSFQKLLRAITILSITFFSLYLATIFSMPLNLILDWIKSNF